MAQSSMSASGTLGALGTLGERLLTTVLPLFNSGGRKHGQKKKIAAATAEWNDAALDEILGRVTTVLLLPLVRSFAPLSTNFLSALLLPRNSKNKAKNKATPPGTRAQEPTDIRPDAFALLDRTLEALSASALAGAAPVVQRIKHVLILEAARELLELYSDSRPGTNTHAAGRSEPASLSASSVAEARAKAVLKRNLESSVDRVGRLARKDALWYLCNTLQRVLPLGGQPSTAGAISIASPAAGGEQDGLLEETLYGMLSRLLRAPPPSRLPTHAPPADEEGANLNANVPVQAPAAGTLTTPERADDGSPGRPRYGSEGARAPGMGEVERGMVLAVVERVWLGVAG